MSRSAYFGIHNIFSLASRKRCMQNFKRLTIPKFGKDPDETTAVLVALCKVEDVPSILYTVRSSYQGTNGVDVGFPGGKSKPNESIVETALRETEEEIGLMPIKIDVWGSGPALAGNHNRRMITPVIGSIANISREDLKINDEEVAEVITVAVELLCNPENQFHTHFSNGGVAPVFVAEQYKIRGVTAYITHAVLSSVLSKDVYIQQN